MSRYADPLRCPDCHADLPPGAAACATCALPLLGETASRLFATLSLADRLVADLRAVAAVPAGAPTAPPSPRSQAPASSPMFPASGPPAPVRRGLSTASVPKILLTLGAGCLLVAALVFLAVAFSVLGVGGRTATLVVLTGLAGGLSAELSRRGLRAATEALALVAYGLLALDVVGADRSGWLGDLDAAGLAAVVGLVLALSGTAGALVVRRSAARLLVGGETVAVLGTGLLLLALDLGEWLPVSVSLVLAPVLGGVVAVVAERAGLRLTARGTVAVTGLAWLALVGYAVERTLEHEDSWRLLWLGGHVVPLLAAALLAAVPAAVPAAVAAPPTRLPLGARVAAAAVAHALTVLALLAPAEGLRPTPLTLVALGVLVVTGATAWAAPRPWGLSVLLTGAVAATGTVVVLVGLAGPALTRLVDAAGPVWSGRSGDLLPAVRVTGHPPAPWLLPLGVVVLAGWLWSLAEASPALHRVLDRRVRTYALLSGVAALAAATVLAVGLLPVPVWLVVALLLAAAGGLAGWWALSGRASTAAVAGGFLAAAGLVSLHAEWLTAVALAGLVGLSALLHLRDRSSAGAAAGGALVSAALAGSVWTWADLAAVPGAWAALAGLLALGALVLLAPAAPARLWRCASLPTARIGLEAGAAAAAPVLACAGLGLAPVHEHAGWAAVYLTTAGVVVTVMSLLRKDRRRLGRAGGLLLAAATWVRLWDLGVSAPEAYTLPSALALLVVGAVHLRRHRSASTMTALGPGLALALVPSLLWVLVDPIGLRSLLLGLACLGAVLVGVRVRWSAPVVLGASVGALLVLRLSAPYVEAATPRWVLIGAAGILLVSLGASWERRTTEARRVAGYLRGLQ